MGRHSDPDAVVIGAGVVGATTAYELAVRGVSVLVIDAGAGAEVGVRFFGDRQEYLSYVF